MKERVYAALLGVMLVLSLFAQPGGQSATPEPVKWTITTADAGNGQWDVVFHAVIEEGWSVSSQETFGDMGPWPTSIRVDSVAGVTVLGQASETGKKVIDGHDPVFDMTVKKFKGGATFTQRISVVDPATPITGFFEYMTCDDEMCLPPATVYFILGLASGTYELGDVSFDPNDPKFAGIATKSDASELKLAGVDLENPVVRDEGKRTEDRNSLLWIFMLGFVGGLVALLTPCVFPMIPLTVSFFTKSSTDRISGLRNALTY
ncbi:MAG: hypothetical protein ACK6A5_03385, partial [Flavobacteriales bacterium]